MKTDQQLENEVFKELESCPFLNADNLSIGVKDGVVTLAGQVGSMKEKWAAEESAWRVAGGRAIAVNVQVNLLHKDQITDTELAAVGSLVMACAGFLVNLYFQWREDRRK